MTVISISRAETLHAKLAVAFDPDFLQVIDESDVGDAQDAAAEEAGTHFRIIMRAPAFDWLTRIERRRAVQEVLIPDLLGGIQALELELEGSGA